MKLHYSTMSSAAKKAYLLAHPTCPMSWWAGQPHRRLGPDRTGAGR
ncbi:hypothetical protein AB0A98_28645 [Streptomyces chrestomyceticus]